MVKLFLAAMLLGRVAAAAPSQDYAQAVADFQSYAQSKRAGIKNDDNMPFLLTHGARTSRSILMVHGYTDSPYYMRALADVFYSEGFNVVAILLPGHGTKPEDLQTVKLRQWERETQLGYELAAGLGDEVSLAGFSTGGGLILDSLAWNVPSGGVFLFSPALALAADAKQKAELDAACADPSLTNKFKPWYGDDATVPETNPYRYTKMATNGICRVFDLTILNQSFRSTLLAAIKKSAGVFAVESEADTTVSPQAVETFMGSLPSGVKSDFILYPKSDGIAHSSVPRPETNPFYGAMVARLRTFIERPAPSPSLDALKSLAPRQ